MAAALSFELVAAGLGEHQYPRTTMSISKMASVWVLGHFTLC